MDPKQVADLATVRRRVTAYAAGAKVSEASRVWAATALIIADGGDGLDVAFIQRPTRPSDRWSGQMALPGGKRDAGDRDAVATATREAREEVGIDLPAPVGRLDDVRGRTLWGDVASYVFTLEQRPLLRPAPGEVATAVWIPLRTLFSADAAVRHRKSGLGLFPAIRHEDYLIWGLTHRIVGSLAAALGVELPDAR